MKLGNRQRAILRDLRAGARLQWNPDREYPPARLESTSFRGMYVTIDKRPLRGLYARNLIAHVPGEGWQVTDEGAAALDAET